MANMVSAEKRNRQAQKRRTRNVQVRTRVKSAVKKVRDTAGTGDAPASKTALLAAISELSKAASKGVIHKNAASRKIGRLTKAVAALK